MYKTKFLALGYKSMTKEGGKRWMNIILYSTWGEDLILGSQGGHYFLGNIYPCIINAIFFLEHINSHLFHTPWFIQFFNVFFNAINRYFSGSRTTLVMVYGYGMYGYTGCISVYPSDIFILKEDTIAIAIWFSRGRNRFYIEIFM